MIKKKINDSLIQELREIAAAYNKTNGVEREFNKQKLSGELKAVECLTGIQGICTYSGDNTLISITLKDDTDCSLITIHISSVIYTEGIKE